MKLALLATLAVFGGSLAGFGLTTGVSSSSPVPVAASPAPAATEDVVVRGHGRDCPKAVKAERL